MHTISLKTPIPGPKSQALLGRRTAAVPQGPFNIAPNADRSKLDEGLDVIEKQLSAG